MKYKWLLVLAATLVVACQKPAPPVTAPVAKTTGESAVTNDEKPAPEKASEETAVEDGKTEGDNAETANSDVKPVEPTESAAEKVIGLVSGYTADLQKWTTAMGAASADERRTLLSERPDAQATWDKIKEILDSSEDAEARVEGLLFTATFLRDTDATEELVRDHASNTKVLPLIMTLGQTLPGQAEALLESLAADEENTPAKGAAMFSLGQLLEEKDGARAEELLVKATTDFADLEINGVNLAEMAGPTLFAIQHLGIGKVAPDIEGTDLDDVAFKLSDYRGKVVVIDFWGDW